MERLPNALPILRTYLEAKRKGEDTTGMAMSTMVQTGLIRVFDLGRSTDEMPCLVDNRIICPLKHLESIKAEWLWAAMEPHFPFSVHTSCELVRVSMTVVMVVVCDRASANKKLVAFLIKTRLTKIYLIVVYCTCHIIHSCSGSQTAHLDHAVSTYFEASLPAPASSESAVGAPGGSSQPAAAANGPKGGKKGRGKGKHAPAEAASQSTKLPKPRKPPTFVSSLVRGANLCGQHGIWKKMRTNIALVVESSLKTICTDDLDRQRDLHLARWQTNMKKNTLLLKVFLGYKENGMRSIDRSCGQLLERAGRGDWVSGELIVVVNGNQYIRNAKVEIVELARHIFMGHHPVPPAEGRWTGVPGAAAFFGALLGFLGSLTQLFGDEIETTTVGDEAKSAAAPKPKPKAKTKSSAKLSGNIRPYITK